MTTLLLLCWEFFKTGLFAVGGGLATLPFLTQMQARYGWFSADMLANMIAISESTPGPIGINMATYVGYTTCATIGGVSLGILGALLATFFLVLPSVIVILIIARFLKAYQQNRLVQGAFACLRPAVAGLIGAAGFSVLKIALLTGAPLADGLFAALNLPALALFAVLLVLLNVKRVKNLHPILFIAAGAVAGVLLRLH